MLLGLDSGVLAESLADDFGGSAAKNWTLPSKPRSMFLPDFFCMSFFQETVMRAAKGCSVFAPGQRRVPALSRPKQPAAPSPMATAANPAAMSRIHRLPK